jgi:S1-C subfamily serine protease
VQPTRDPSLYYEPLERADTLARAPISRREASGRPHPIDELAGLADPEKRGIAKLGIVGIDVGDATAAMLPGLRISSGVVVAARTQVSSGNEVPLVTGDVIHAVNSFAVRSVDSLRVLVDDVKANSELVLQIERNGQLMFVTCQIY